MTILTKPSSEKKKEAIVEEAPVLTESVSAANGDPEAQSADVLIMATRARRLSTTTHICLLLLSLLVVTVGIIGGKFLYDEYMSTQVRRLHSMIVPIPTDLSWLQNHNNINNYDDNNVFALATNTDEDDESDDDNNRQPWEVNANAEIPRQESYLMHLMERIWQPHLLQSNQLKEIIQKIGPMNGYLTTVRFRQGENTPAVKQQYIHDFSVNLTAIVNSTSRECLIMPLDREQYKPMMNLVDMIQQAVSNKFMVNNTVVHQTMRKSDEIVDRSTLGQIIADACERFEVHRMEKLIGGVVKRSIQPMHSSYIEYVDKFIVYDIVD